ncbi:MAG: hypothetical protein HOA08_02235 [Rhodospirillaceae bacterium]|mgnify:FL=1|jgi:hypothetical protein|nr:hypothetical protein [Rhodospirillaceae bacterium]MBT3495209.1 hypothetical protein [Rhodospirillaceae bacterium]MBT3780536.1 hypothetical protein [Rhodospirillaceae bacterium]MBT3979305.1 hypothetical protein [Rhodospirillaceae bacterium]MBT4170091.1 hypothetical protein [Rhodospirillaceae bacterium]
MATKPKTKSETKKTDSTASKSEAAKSETSTAAADTSSSESGSTGSEGGSGDGSAGGSGGGSGKSSAPSRPISYFSSVSTDDYRSGWDGVFGGGDKMPARARAKPVAKRKKTLPATIVLDSDDLDKETREQIDVLLRRHAKKKRLNYDKLSKKGQVSWHLTCNISDI